MGLLYLRACLVAVFFVRVRSDPTRDCADIYTCAECIQNSVCGWCSHVKSSSAETFDAKCLLRSLLNKLCDDSKKEAPEPKVVVLKDTPVGGAGDETVVQLQPQQVSVHMLAGTTYPIEFKFKKANDYPVDLYYLLDFSSSMFIYKKTLSNLGALLAKEMANQTSSLQMGFGSFVDKVADPFTHTDPESLQNPCLGKGEVCTRPYSFKNHMPLTRNTQLFSTKLEAAQISGNSDTPEGGFDGLLQAMVCSNEINWREQSRRIIVFCTDGPFHIAGDGKLVGVVEPHDGKCHLNASGDYTHALELDYPSISMINFKAKENYINVIFAVTDDNMKTYSRLKDAIEGASAGVLKSEGDIIDLVIKSYHNMSVSIDLTHNATGSVQVQFSSLCLSDGAWTHTSGCAQLKMGSQVRFRAILKVLDCSVPEQIIEIKPVGMAESLLVYLKVYCDCQCEKDNNINFKLNAIECSGRGNLTCGRCTCPESHRGHRCECEGSGYHDDISSCHRNCSGKGTCVCGTCKCDQPNNPNYHISGDFCECDNFTCPGGLTLCSGHGLCVCGRCLCDSEWSGDSCNCSLNSATCRTFNENGGSSICSGRGRCDCGTCACNLGPRGKYYKGKYCEKCVDCQVECTELMHKCIECIAYDAKNVENCSGCQDIFKNVTLIEDASVMQNISVTSILCQPLEKDDEGCTYHYVPYYHEDDILVYADLAKTCPETVNVLAISAGVAGGTLLAGFLILLIWKLFTTIHDKREFEKFEQQRAKTKWGRGDNPLYRRALTTHVNPTFDEDDGKFPNKRKNILLK